MNETDVNKKTVEQILKENEEMIVKYKAKIKELFPQETNYLFDYDNTNTKQSTPKFLFETFGNNDSTFQCSNNVKKDLNVNDNILSSNKNNDDVKGKERINSFLKSFNEKMKLNLDNNNNNVYNNNTINNGNINYNKYTFLKSPQSNHKPTTNITISDSDNDSDDNSDVIVNYNKQQIVSNNNNKQRNKHNNNHHHYVKSSGNNSNNNIQKINKPYTKIQPSKYKPKLNQRYKSNPNKKNIPHPFNPHLTITPSMIFDKYNLNLNHPKRKLLYHLYIHYIHVYSTSIF